MSHPFPNLQVQPASGLSFPWAEISRGVMGTSTGRYGPQGPALGMVIAIYWRDLQRAVKEIVGYSYRDASNGGPPSWGGSYLRRVLPWQHPYFNQLWAKEITQVQGVRPEGKNTASFDDDFLTGVLAGAGAGAGTNLGPWTDYRLALLTVQFWRPPYAVRTDADILIPNPYGSHTMVPAEWLRYMDRHWKVTTQILWRDQGAMEFTDCDGNNPAGSKFKGSVGQRVQHLKLSRTWYQVPEACLFGVLSDASPQGLPTPLLFQQSLPPNPITGWLAGSEMPIAGCVNSPMAADDHTKWRVTGTSTFDTNTLTGLGANELGQTVDQFVSPGDFAVTLSRGLSTASYVVSVDSTSQVTVSRKAVRTNTGLIWFVSDASEINQFLGFPMGTLLFEGAEITPQPLQLPPALMGIAGFGSNEPISQIQYNVTLHFDYFDPPRRSSNQPRGHNLVPWAGNGFWYPNTTVDLGPLGGLFATSVRRTPYDYADLSDLFKVL